ncbi:hypothetical protein D3C73_1643000 [compost metagenome]
MAVGEQLVYGACFGYAEFLGARLRPRYSQIRAGYDFQPPVQLAVFEIDGANVAAADNAYFDLIHEK